MADGNVMVNDAESWNEDPERRNGQPRTPTALVFPGFVLTRESPVPMSQQRCDLSDAWS